MTTETSDTSAAVRSRHLNDCTHRWRIDAPNGPRSSARCGQCGAIREFTNTPAGLTYQGWREQDGGGLRRGARRAHRLSDD